MSFNFNWPREFSSSFYDHAKQSLEQALNQGGKLALVADKIAVRDLDLGSVPPELDLLGIDELSIIDGSFVGRFMLSYAGDAFISLAANLQVNPLRYALEMLATPSVLLTTAQMHVHLTLSALRLRCVIVLSFSKKGGLSLVFKDDPLESLNVSSSFDSIGVVQQVIQSEIENQLRERFRRDLPSLIHRLSQRWLADLNQQPPASAAAPIVVEHEREPDESFGDPDMYAAEFEYDSDEVERSMRAPSPAVSSDSELESEGEDSDGPPGHPAAQSAGHSRQTSANRTSQTPAISPSKASPIKSFMDRMRQRSSSSTSATNAGDKIAFTESSVLRSLRGDTTNFATTFSEAPQLAEPEKSLDLTTLLGASPNDRKATRRRIHRLEGPSPATSPQKSKTLRKATSRAEIKRADMDEYFPVRSASEQLPPPRLDYRKSALAVEYPKMTGMRYNPDSNANKPSLRRNMLSSRLRESDYFTPNFPR